MIFSVESQKVFKVNTYIITDDKDNCVIIDPGVDEKVIDNKLNTGSLTPLGVVVTHGHFDHIGSVAYFQKKYDIPYYIHSRDVKLSKSANFFLKIGNFNHSIETPIPDVILEGDSGNIQIGPFTFNYYNVNGHSEGGIVIEYKNTIFTGDMLYKNGIRLNAFPHENKDKLKCSILKIFRIFNGEYKVYPGHGSAFTLDEAIRSNQELIRFLNQNDES